MEIRGWQAFESADNAYPSTAQDIILSTVEALLFKDVCAVVIVVCPDPTVVARDAALTVLVLNVLINVDTVPNKVRTLPALVFIVL
jgi:hypothetical protein